MNNNNCDGSGPHSINPEVRVLPTGGDSNAILCFTCFLRELQFRKQRNKELSKESQFKLPSWESLKKYDEARKAVGAERCADCGWTGPHTGNVSCPKCGHISIRHSPASF